MLGGFAMAAHGAIIEQAWFEDASGQMTIQQARESDQWMPYQGLLSRGYGTGAVWVRLVIAPHPSQSLILAMRPAYLDQIEIYELEGQQPRAVVGDLSHPQEAERIAQSFNYTLSASSEPVALWLRLTSTSTRQLQVEVLSEPQWVASQLSDQMGSVFYVIALFVLLLTALIQWQLTQDRVFGAFALSVGTACAYGLSVTGLLRLIWPVDWSAEALDAYQSFFSVAATAAGIVFHMAFLKRLGLPHWAVVITRIYLIYQFAKFGVLFSGQTILALTLNLFDVLIAPPLMLLLAFFSGRDPTADRSLPHWLVIALYVVLVGFMLLAALPGLGWVAGPEFSLYVVQFNALATTVLILGILQYRQRRLNQQRNEFQAKAWAAEKEAEKERFARTEQRQLLDMLTHELKTPLAVMRMRLQEDHASSTAISQAIGDMSLMIERCSQANQAEDGRLTVIYEPIDIFSLLTDMIERMVANRPVNLSMGSDDERQTELTSDSHLLSVVLTNLIENACKYSPPQSEIGISVDFSVDGGVLVTIENLPGQAGWPDAAHVFDKYYRSSHARRQSGTGLGLFLARSLSQVLGGRLDYVPSQSHIRFVLWLPESHLASR